MSDKDEASPEKVEPDIDEQDSEESETAKRKSNGFNDEEKVKRQKTDASPETTDDDEESDAEKTESSHHSDSEEPEEPEKPEEDVKTEEPAENVQSPSNDDEKELDVDQDASTTADAEINPLKKSKSETNDRKVQNLRKNIKDVIDESQLDETTLVAQRQESERLARLQEQQRLIRENQRQIAADKQANKTQLKVLSLLQGESPASSSIDFNDPIFEKLNFNPAISITPAAKETLNSLQSLISTEDHIPDSASDSDDDVVIQPTQVQKPVVIDSSSDSDDCVILSSDEDEEEIPEEDEENSGEHTNDSYNQKDSEGRVVVNIGHSESKPIYIAPQLARIIKPHQIGGIRFLFDNIIENVELFDKSSGFGCILAHSMGLGKTLQLVCFCDIFLRHTSAKKIIIIMPINTLQNWLNEFNMWLPLPENADKSPLNEGGEVRPRHFNIYVLNDSQKTLTARAKTVIEWSTQGGVLLLGYEMYRLLSLRKTKKKKGKGFALSDDKETLSVDDQDMFDKINRALVNPGPDLVVCDEGHRIKNAHATTSMALKQIKTKRRIVLTGYPLQNNLLEYWCMVDFTRPSYLGTKTEFCNMFERPIQNGQCIDSTPQDCKLMRYRAHVLHSLLKGFVQRRSHTVLQKSLPDKTEFVLMFRMTDFQRKLYTVFMNEVVRSKKVPNPLKAFAVCCKIWNHPDVLHNFLKKRELDLDIELEEAESVGKGNNAKRKVRKGKDQKPADVKREVKDEKESQSAINSLAENLKTIATTSSDKQKLSMSNVLSPDSNYSTNCKSFDSSSGSLNSYAGFQSYDSSSSQSYGYNQNGYQNWNDGGYWQNNLHYYNSEYTQSYNQGQSYPPYYPSSNQPETMSDSNSKISSSKYDAGLLADVIKEETMGKNNKNQALDEIEKKDPPASKSSREDGIPYDWALELMKDYIPNLLENSPKLEIFFTILNESVRMGDRLLVFSQSLLTLNLMEKFLQRNKIPNADTLWAKNTSYFRLDGTTAALEREKLINEFNANDNVKLFLVSTRAGSLGINLVGANRVIVFDASWNPCHDTQAVCRVYRYGQTKSCYVYRFVMDNCLEKKIYDRQINKQGMADRIVDECNPDAHLSLREVTSLCYDDGVDPDVKDFSLESHKYEDMVSKKVLELHSKSLTKEPFKQESLLVDRKEKKLSQAEKRLAQKGYEMEKQAASKPFGYNPVGSNYRPFRPADGLSIHRPFTAPRSEHSEYSEPSSFDRASIPRPNRWVPVEVWQSKGLTAQEMTLPQDVSIQTNSADKSKIYLKAGQKVIVLKSPKGICLQLESGKVIAIRASAKTSQPNSDKLDNFAALKPNPLNPNLHRAPLGTPQNSGDIIDISNDDDDDVVGASTNKATESIAKIDTNGTKPIDTLDQPYKEKTVYKPNLVKRRTKAYPSMPEPNQLGSFDMTFHSNKAQEWNSMKPYTLGSSQSLAPSSRATNFLSTEKSEQPQQNMPYGQSSFPPSGNDHAPYVGAPYGQQSSYQSFQQNYTQPQEFSQYNSSSSNFPYNSYPNNTSNYSYPVQENYDANMTNYHTGYNLNYNQTAPKHSYKLPDAPT